LNLKARETALHWAAKRNYPAIVKHLLEKGADPNAADLVISFCNFYLNF